MDREYREPECLKRDSDPKPEALSTARSMFARPLDPLGKGLLMGSYVPSSAPQERRLLCYLCR